PPGRPPLVPAEHVEPHGRRSLSPLRSALCRRLRRPPGSLGRPAFAGAPGRFRHRVTSNDTGSRDIRSGGTCGRPPSALVASTTLQRATTQNRAERPIRAVRVIGDPRSGGGGG